ncbi:tensin-4-like [Schistocerca piceifrons]|uniref:tensin-4-like n=1 Tax=Schistocerca piceifrons TaxID=274613 RepID=UPI001F5E3E3F|nr:tensin-4-like [Schistocerca piceifrons]
MEAPQPQHGAASSDEDNSPTELNSCRRLADKPPLVKRLDCLPTPNDGGGGDLPLDDDPPCWNAAPHPAPPSAPAPASPALPTAPPAPHDTSQPPLPPLPQSPPPQPPPRTGTPPVDKTGGSVCPCHADCTPDKGTPATSPRHQPLEMREPWFRTGMPRETALEVLDHEPEGAFMVRESTSKPGCYALSLRVPRDFQPSGIAHYLILRTAKGYKIKGFTKEFSSLASLITHHSVMPELLPVPLALSRYRPALGKSDSSRDFSDGDCDRDYNTLADLRQMLAELKM